jgi:hypothetical protein
VAGLSSAKVRVANAENPPIARFQGAYLRPAAL